MSPRSCAGGLPGSVTQTESSRLCAPDDTVESGA